MRLAFQEFEISRIQARNFVMSPLELKDYVDFEVRRVYFISLPTGPTSAHCHLEEKEFFIMISGSCTAVIDRGKGLEEIAMRTPTSAIYVGNLVWHHFKDFSEDAILLALSSTNYRADRSDYIEDYATYRNKLIEIGAIHA